MSFLKDQINPNRLRLGQLIGSGGFGIVFSGSFEIEKNKPISVAIKRVLIPSDASEAVKKEVSEGVIKEVSLLRTVKHEKIIECYGFVNDANAVDAAGEPLGVCIVLGRGTKSLREALDNLRRRRDGGGGGGGGGGDDSTIEDMLCSPEIVGKVISMCMISGCQMSLSLNQ